MKKRFFLISILSFLFFSCSGTTIKTHNGITTVPQSLFGMGNVYCFGVKNSPGNNGWYTLEMDSPTAKTGILDIDGNKKKVTVSEIKTNSIGECISITIDGKTFTAE